jgi:putative colanic acid biosysnthesis UDP-glucose lipid carrier transferase
MSAALDTLEKKRARVATARTPERTVTALHRPGSRVRLRHAGRPQGNAALHVTQPVLFKRQSALAAFILSLRAAAPAMVVSLSLYVSARAHGIELTELFSTLTVVVTILSMLLLQPSRSTTGELLAPRLSVAGGLLLRWCALLAALFLIGYVAGFHGRHVDLYAPSVMLTWAVATPSLLIAVTLALHELSRRIMRRPGNSRTAIFVGCNETSVYLAECFARHSELCVSVAGFFDDRSPQRLNAPVGLPLLGAISALPAYVRHNDVDVIFISLPLRHLRRVRALLDALHDTTVSIYYVPDVFVSELFEVHAGEILGAPVIAMRETPFHGYRGFMKRLTDLVIASSALLLLLPLLVAIALGVKLTGPGPVIFGQRRYGLDGREITIYKFRTMRVLETSGWLNQARPNDERVTPFGRFLRRWSLDELPQLINVLQGRMSLVGPRPHAVAHNEEYRRLIRGYMVRHKVPPGITGLAQVNGFRGETRRLEDMQARVRCDLEYVRNWSLGLDLKILLMTLPRLLKSDRAY